MAKTNFKKLYQQELQKIIKALKAYRPEKVILFGSAARQQVNSLSDIDLLIIKRTEKPFLERNIEAHRLIYSSYGFKVSTDVFVLTPEELEKGILREEPFVTDILSQGKVVYEG